MDTNRLRLSVSAGEERCSSRNGLQYFADCNFSTSGVESLADDFDVRKGPVSSRVALLLRSAEGKPYFASISSILKYSKYRFIEGENNCQVGLWLDFILFMGFSLFLRLRRYVSEP